MAGTVLSIDPGRQDVACDMKPRCHQEVTGRQYSGASCSISTASTTGKVMKKISTPPGWRAVGRPAIWQLQRTFDSTRRHQRKRAQGDSLHRRGRPRDGVHQQPWRHHRDILRRSAGNAWGPRTTDDGQLKHFANLPALRQRARSLAERRCVAKKMPLSFGLSGIFCALI